MPRSRLSLHLDAIGPAPLRPVRTAAYVHMNTTPRQTVQWFVLGLLSHLVLLLTLFASILLLPDSWRGRMPVQGYRALQYGGTGGWSSTTPREVLLITLVALASIVVRLLVVWLSWNRRRWFAVGFLIPALWGILYLLKPA